MNQHRDSLSAWLLAHPSLSLSLYVCSAGLVNGVCMSKGCCLEMVPVFMSDFQNLFHIQK